MATIKTDATKPFVALSAEAIAGIRQHLATIDRIASAALAAAFDKGGQSPDFSALTSGDFGVIDGAADGQAWYEAHDAIRRALTGQGVAQGAAQEALNKLDKGA